MALRTSRRVSLLVVGTMALAACGGGSGSEDDDASGAGDGAANEVDSVTLAVGGVGSTGYLGYFVAEGKGMLEDCLGPLGVKVNVQGFSGSSDAMQALVSGQADFATAGLSQVAQVRSGGRDARAVMAFNGGNIQVVASSDLPENLTIEDVAGLTWGVGSIGSLGHQESLAIARVAEVDESDIEFVGIGGPAGYVAALETGQVDLVTVGEPYASQMIHDGTGRLLVDFYDPDVVDEAFPGGFVTTSLLTSDEFREANPKVTQALVDAVLQGQEAAHNLSPEEVADAVPDISKGHDGYWANALKTILQSTPEDGQISEKAAENVLKGEDKGGRLEGGKTVKAKDLYTNEYVEAAVKTDPC
jgi:NitT/TauT family transport system substrate-binding protein